MATHAVNPNKRRSLEPSRYRPLLSFGVPVLLWFCAGCSRPTRLASYPPDTLHVQYEPATTYSTCLVASVAMVANYLEGQRRFTVPNMVRELRKVAADESRVEDVRDYVTGRGLHLIALSGRLDDRPEQGLAFWVRSRGYPAVCIINRAGDDKPDFNHAVVVIGVQRGVDSAEIIQYLDPSADQPLYSCDRKTFETVWARCDHAMLLVVRPPPP